MNRDDDREHRSEHDAHYALVETAARSSRNTAKMPHMLGCECPHCVANRLAGMLELADDESVCFEQ